MREDIRNEGESGLSSWWAVREVDHLFAALGRYTRFVVYGKWSLILIACVLVLSLIVWPLVSKDRSGMRVSFVDPKSVPQQPTSPVMQNPIYRGIGDNGQQFKVIGKRAIQQTPTLAIIEQVEGQMLKAAGGWYSLTADRAEYQQDRKLLELIGNVTVIDEKGTTFTTERATVDVPTMHVTGHVPITGVGAMGNISASAFEILDNGDHIIFTGTKPQLKVIVDRAARK